MSTENQASGRSEPQDAKLALLAKKLKGRSSSRTRSSIPPRPNTGPAPLSFAQQRLWLMDRLSGGGPAYNIPIALRLEGPLDRAVLNQVISKIVARHESLRTTFQETPEGAVQVVNSAEFVTIPVIDLTPVSASQREATVSQLISDEAGRPFDLARGPLFRVSLINISVEHHLLLLTLHHIVADGWSLGVLIHEVAELYRAFRNCAEAELPDLAIQYADFASWQRGWLQGEVLESQLRYWRQKLSEPLPYLSVPPDHPRPLQNTFRGANFSFSLDSELSTALQERSRQEGVTLFMVLLAAFQVLLHRCTGQEDILIGSPIANRNRVEIEPLIGFFVNTLLLRTDVGRNPTFRDLLQRVRETTLEAYAHQDVPFERLVEELQPERDLSLQPLCRITFALQNAPKPALELSDLKVTVIESHNATAKFDIALHMWEADGIHGRFEYSTALFDEGTIARMANQLRHLLSDIVVRPHAPISELRLGEAVESSDGPSDDAEPESVPLLIERQVQATPAALAVRMDDTEWSYQELNRRADWLANYLRHHGASAETTVGILMDRSLEMVAAILGSLKAGAAYVPLDPDYPEDRLRYMASDAGISILLTHHSMLTRTVAPEGALVLAVEENWSSIAAAPLCQANRVSSLDHAAYIIYTSGSTGTPKGVVISRRALANHMRWMASVFPLTPSDRVLQKTPFGFDASVWEFYAPLLAGSALVMAKPGIHQDSRLLVDATLAEKVTILQVVPSMLAMMVREPDFKRCTNLRLVFCGGEQLPAPVVERFHSRLTATLVNLYGPTEATIDTAFWECSRVDQLAVIPIGRPVLNTRLYILDAEMRPVPTGIPGELYIGGTPLARGYLRRPEFTAERFLPNPYARIPGERLYRTGDICRRLANGAIEYIGRNDKQVKLHGHRIELGEVEQALRRHRSVRDAAAAIREDASGEPRLIAYITTSVEDAGELGTAQVAQWSQVFEQTYQESAESAIDSYDTVGWKSSYTGERIAISEMLEWQSATLDRIHAFEPKRVFEIGCGTGLILLPLARQCETYWGSDISRHPLDYIRGQLESSGINPAKIHLRQQPADDFLDIPPHAFDLVVLNSVVQYFPSRDYLLRVLAASVRALEPGGRIFLGDIRDYRLLEAFHTSVHLHRAAATTNVRRLRELIRQSATEDEELLIHPRFFTELKKKLPQATSVEVHLKRGLHHNELTLFRYDAVLRVGGKEDLRLPFREYDWTSGQLTLDVLAEELRKRTEPLWVRRVLNARVARHVAAVHILRDGPTPRTTTDLKRIVQEFSSGVDPEDLWNLGSRLGYAVRLLASEEGEGELLDAYFIPIPLLSASIRLPRHPVQSVGADTNEPVRAAVSRLVVPELRRRLKAELPGHLVPAAFVALESLPLTQNGKLDRRRLPGFDPHLAASASSYVGPATHVERTLVEIWAEVLGLDKIGTHDNFFELGGHSLLGAQVISRVRDRFGCRILLRSLFENPTIAGFATVVESATQVVSTLPTPSARTLLDGPIPASYAQQRMWFLNRLEPSSAVYNIPIALKLRGELDIAALERAVNRIVARHEALRTTFVEKSGEPFQLVHPMAALRVPTIDLTHLSSGARESALQENVRALIDQPFDLERDLPFRVALLQPDHQEHVFVLVLHHICGDGWSLGIIAREIGAIYESETSGGRDPLPDITLQYADYALWQREDMTGEILDSQMHYWSRQLEGIPSELALPADRSRQHHHTYVGAAVDFEIPATSAKLLEQLCRDEGATLYMGLLAVFQSFLFRYTGQDDLVVGSPIANRQRREFENTVGFFVNTLAIRGDLSGQPSFIELLRRTRETTLAAFANQDLPFERLVQQLQPVRDLNRNPIFQVLFALQNAPGEPVSLPGVQIHPYPLPQHHTRFDMEAHFWSSGERISGLLLYNAGMFDERTVRRWQRHFVQLLEAVLQSPWERIAALPLLSARETHQLQIEWNDTERPEPEAITLLLQRQAVRRADTVAVEFAGETTTYAELERRSNQLARYLRRLGVRSESTVAICLDRSPAMILTIVSIWKAGAAYVAVDASLPARRQEFILRDAGATMVITRTSARSAPFDENILTVDLDSICTAVDQEDVASLQIPEGDLGYVLYTSGSTGTPKGVEMRRAPLENLIHWQMQRSGSQPGRTLQFSPVSFDVSFQEIFSTLCAGGTLVLIGDDTRRDAAELLNFLEQHKIERLFLPFVALQQLGQHAALRQHVPASLREVITAGEQLKITRELREFFRSSAGCTLDNQYGPTETHVVSAFQMNGAPCDWDSLPPVGRPISNSRIHILDREMLPVPIGVVGEIYLGGDTLARGYAGRPDLTAAAFVPNPVPQRLGERLYRTGDRARYLPDGNIQFLGRIDRQTKIRGHRVEPGEVEAVLRLHPDIVDAVVSIQTDPSGNNRLVAYVVSSREGRDFISSVFSHLRSALAAYLVPSAIVRLDRFPLTRSGKVDLLALPPADFGAAQAGAQLGHRTPTEEILASIWKKVLGAPTIERTSNFFDLGGHSLLGTQLISRVRDTFRVDLPLRRLFEEPTLAGLAAAVDDAVRDYRGWSEPPLVPVDRSSPLPLSFAQQRLWFLEQLTPGTAGYNLPGALSLFGPLQVEALRRSFEELVVRHEALRTVFRAENGEAVQIVLPATQIELLVTVLTDLSTEEKRRETDSYILREAQRSFDLQTGPLLRASLLRLDAEEHVLVFVMHHIAADGWSLRIAMQELRSLYGSFAAGSNPALESLPIQYADYAVWQRSWLTGEVLDAQLRYWKTQLADSTVSLDLPTDFRRPARQTYHGSRESILVDAKVTTRLRELSAGEGVTLFMTLMAAFQCLLFRYTGQDDISVGSPIANRNRQEIEGLIGFFVNTLVIRGRFNGDPSWREFLHRIRETALGAFAHQDLPFEQLVEALQPPRELNQSPLFQVLFVLQTAVAPVLELPGLRLIPREAAIEISRFDLTLAMEETADGMTAAMEYKTNLFQRSTILRMLSHLRALLEAIAVNPEVKVSALPFLEESETLQLLTVFQGPNTEQHGETHVHQLIQQQAHNRPELAAVICTDRVLTYGELNRRANCLAHFLRSLGVGPEVPVAVHFERSTDMVVAVLAVLKAGGAYVPIDPAYPTARISYVLDDIAAGVVLTHQRHLTTLPEFGGHCVCLDSDWETIASHPAADPEIVTTLDNLAYVIYTSGSTGHPKGVQVNHRNLFHSTSARFEHYPGEVGRFLLLSSLAFDSSVAGLFWTLTQGGALVLPREGAHYEISEIDHLIQSHHVTHLLCLPSLYLLLLQHGGISGECALRIAIVAGEPSTAELFDQHVRQLPRVRLYNEYGPTEASVWCSVYSAGELPGLSTVPIGRPIVRCRIYILDRFGNLVPPGHPGELCVGGLGITRGYLNRPDLTAEKFMPDPFCADSGGRLYRTGDLARHLPSGDIEFLGRIDGQIKLRGYRIETGEIESVLLRHPDVTEAVAIVRPNTAGGRLIAYITTESSEVPSDLESALAAQLPPYMIPTVQRLDRLPVHPNGKVDRQALIARKSDYVDAAVISAEPETDLQATLLELWRDVLEAPLLGIDDGFFSSGGHSLLATQLVARIQKTLHPGVRLNMIFEFPTVRRLAEQMEGLVPAGRTLHELQAFPALLEAVDRTRREADGESPPIGAVFADPCLLALKPHGERNPFFCIHPGSGSSGCYFHLAQRFDKDRPFYGIQAKGLDGESSPHETVEEMAGHYLAALRRVQRKGPYLLGGWSSGGLVAFEMARQLQVCGESVSLLALMDTVVLSTLGTAAEKDDAEILTELFQDRLPLSIDHLRQLSTEQQVEYIAGLLQVHSIVPKTTSLRWLSGYFGVFKTMYRASLRYMPQACGLPVTLLRASQASDEFSADPLLGWSPFAESPNVVWLPCTHASMVNEPEVESLAAELTNCMRELP